MMQPGSGHNAYIPMVTGDQFVEPLGNNPVRIGGARIAENDAVPSSGGYQTLLDAGVMASEIRALDAVRVFLETLTGELYLYKERPLFNTGMRIDWCKLVFLIL